MILGMQEGVRKQRDASDGSEAKEGVDMGEGKDQQVEKRLNANISGECGMEEADYTFCGLFCN